MQKIKTIILRNFKYFFGKETSQLQNKIDLNRNNLLLYGENGSGKSSLYWALYTFLQSAIKNPRSEIEKYFDPNHNQNLRNRFAQPDDESGIVIEFTAPSGGTIKEIKRNSDRTYSINTHEDTFTERVLIGSDFINYKFLSKIYDFRNSEHIDLFDLFERDILMFVDFEESYTENDGTLSTKTFASDWWKFICKAPSTLPYNGKIVSVGSMEYKRLKQITIPRFVDLIKRFLYDITQGANEYLQLRFKEDFTISFDTNNIICEYNKNISQRSKDGKLHKPSIPLIVQLNHDSLAESDRQILKPHTFLNEARLTAIALAIRFSILDRRPKLPNSARILVLDDLLLSLDMSHRDKILDIILSDTFVNTYQILILSHDRSFYNMCKNRIQERFTDGWIFKEMYQHKTINGIPCPFIPEQNNYLDLAKKYLKEFDYPASANYLRKETERVFKYLLPKNLSVFFKEDKGMVTAQLDNLISNFLKYFSELNGNIEPFRKLKEHKDLLLNPLSHDNLELPIYRKELEHIIEILENLNRLKVFTISLKDDPNQEAFELYETDVNGDKWVIDFFLKENFMAIRDLDGTWLLSNPLCNFTFRLNKSQILQKEPIRINPIKLFNGYSNIRFNLGIKTNNMDNPKDLREIIVFQNRKLIDVISG